MKIAVSAATGQLGSLAIASLKKQLPQGQIVALARDPAKGSGLGVEIREADYRKPDTLARALQGVTRLVLISSGDFDGRFAQHLNVIRAAQAAGTGHIIYTSILKGLGSPMLIAEDHKETEKAIVASGIPSTMLRNGWYTENYTGSLGGALAAGAMIGSAGNGQLSTAARADYADAIAAVAAGSGPVDVDAADRAILVGIGRCCPVVLHVHGESRFAGRHGVDCLHGRITDAPAPRAFPADRARGRRRLRRLGVAPGRRRACHCGARSRGRRREAGAA
jgi:uncharacterized protein YbjT (DUF2867 family)